MGEGTAAASLPPKIAMALVKAAAVAEAVEKRGTVKTAAYSYKFAGADALMSEARSALAEAGLAIVLSRWWLQVERTEGIGDDGKPWVDYQRTVFAEFMLVHSEGDCCTIGPYQMPVVLERGRGLDKADAAALTYATGYVMRGLLCLPRVEEGSQVDERDDSRRTHERESPKAAALTPLEAISARLEQVTDLGMWCDEYGARAVKAVSLDKLRGPLLLAAKRLGVSEGEALAMIAKSIGDAKRGGA